jgi:hypothetical protein
MLPFQFRRPASGYLISKWFLRKSCDNTYEPMLNSNDSLFTLDSGFWDITGSAEISNGKLRSNTSSSGAEIEASSIFTIGKKYTIKIIVSEYFNLGLLNLTANYASGDFSLNGTGTYTFNIVATGTAFIIEALNLTGSNFVIDSVQIFEVVSSIGTDIALNDTLLKLINIGTEDVINYCGQNLPIQIPCGQYYMIIVTEDNTMYFSEVITVKDFIPSQSPYVMLEWSNECDLGDVIFQPIIDCSYKNRLYLNAPLSNLEYPIKEEGEEDGNSDFNPTFQKWEKKELLTVAKCPEFIVDALTAMRLHDTISITKALRKKQVEVLDAISVKSVEAEIQSVLNDCATNVQIKMLYNDKVIDSTCCTNIAISECRTCDYEVDDIDILTGIYYFGTPFGSMDFGLYNTTFTASNPVTGVGTLEYVMDGDKSLVYPIGTKIYVEGVSETDNIGFHEISGVVYFIGTNKTHIQWTGMTTDAGPASGTIKIVDFNIMSTDDKLICVTNATETWLNIGGEYWTKVPIMSGCAEDGTTYDLLGYTIPNTYLKIKATVTVLGVPTIYVLPTSYHAINEAFNVPLIKSELPFTIPLNGTVAFSFLSYTVNCDYGESDKFTFTYSA